MLSVPSGGTSIAGVGKMWPYATTTEMSGSSARSESRNSGPRGLAGWRTGIPSSSAMSLTGGGCSFDRERPTGFFGLRHYAGNLEAFAEQRSQWRCRELRRAPKEHAHSELLVPLVVRCDLGCGQLAHVTGILLSLLRPLRECRPPLERSEVADEQLSVQVVGRVDVERCSVPAKRANNYTRRALHVAVDLGDG